MSKKGVIFSKILISEFSRFLLELILIFTNLIPLKNSKKGVYFSTGPTELTWRGMGLAWMRHGTQGHVAEPREPTQAPAWHGGGADAWQGHTSPRGRLGGATWHEVFALVDDGPMGIVGPGKIVGAVMQRR